MKFADEWWRNQVMALFAHTDETRLHTPLEKSFLYSMLAKDLPLPRLVKEEYIDRAVRQLKAAGKLMFFSDWTFGVGWHVPNYPELKAANERAQQHKRDARNREHDRVMAEHSRSIRASIMHLNAMRRLRGEPEEDLPEPYVPKYPHLDDSKITKLEATADSLEKAGHPEAADSYRSKVAQLRARQA